MVALGFLIPWLLVLLVIGLVVWGVVRLVRSRRSTSAGQSTTAADATHAESVPADDADSAPRTSDRA